MSEKAVVIEAPGGPEQLKLVDVEVGDMNFEQVGSAVLTLEHPEVEPGVPPVCRFQIDKDHKKFEVKELLLRPFTTADW